MGFQAKTYYFLGMTLSFVGPMYVTLGTFVHSWRASGVFFTLALALAVWERWPDVYGLVFRGLEEKGLSFQCGTAGTVSVGDLALFSALPVPT